MDIYLYNGRSFTIKALGEVRKGYVLAEAYKDEELEPNKKTRNPHSEAINPFNQIAIAYESISHVMLTLEEPQAPKRRFKAGFK